MKERGGCETSWKIYGWEFEDAMLSRASAYLFLKTGAGFLNEMSLWVLNHSGIITARRSS